MLLQSLFEHLLLWSRCKIQPIPPEALDVGVFPFSMPQQYQMLHHNSVCDELYYKVVAEQGIAADSDLLPYLLDVCLS